LIGWMALHHGAERLLQVDHQIGRIPQGAGSQGGAPMGAVLAQLLELERLIHRQLHILLF
jgi:hypothetical protein